LRPAFNRESQHCYTVVVWSYRPIGLVRLAASRDEFNAIESGLLQTAVGQSQMSKVDRIETASEDANAHTDRPPSNKARAATTWRVANPSTYARAAVLPTFTCSRS
jgi:hypothetical protein